MKFRIMLNYLMLFICAIAVFSANSVLFLLLPVVQIFLSWMNCRCSDKWQVVLKLEIHLWAATVAGLLTGGLLYLKWVSDDSDSMILLQMILVVGAVLVLILGGITTLIRYLSAKKAQNP